MAKKSDTPAEGEEANVKQEPEKPKKQSHGMSLPMMVGLISGIIFVQVVLIIVIFKMLIPGAPATATADPQAEKASTESEKKIKSDTGSEEDNLTDEEKENLVLHEIKNIAATPRGMDKSAFFTVKFFCIPKEKALSDELKKEFEKNTKGQVLNAETEFKINDIFSKYSKDQIDNLNRDSINTLILKQLQPTFEKEDIKLFKILVTWAFY